MTHTSLAAKPLHPQPHWHRVRPHNTSHSQGVHSSHLKIRQCTVPAEEPCADAVCILNCQLVAKLWCIRIFDSVPQ